MLLNGIHQNIFYSDEIWSYKIYKIVKVKVQVSIEELIFKKFKDFSPYYRISYFHKRS